MKNIGKHLLGALLAVLLILNSGCTPEPQISTTTNIEPLPYQICDWLTTDWDGDEIVLFMTDNGKSISFQNTSGRQMEVGVENCFISLFTITGVASGSHTESNGSTSSTVSYYQTTGILSPYHVGNTYLYVKDSVNETVIPVTIRPEYYTFNEPSLDFDDTQDSVALKLSSLQYTEDGGLYFITDPHTDYSLLVNYTESGTVNSYEVSLREQVSSEELTGYIAERYFKTNAYNNGLPVYIEAYNKLSPSISDASLVIMLDIASRKIVYQNPLTYSK